MDQYKVLPFYFSGKCKCLGIKIKKKLFGDRLHYDSKLLKREKLLVGKRATFLTKKTTKILPISFEKKIVKFLLNYQVNIEKNYVSTLYSMQ